MGTRPRSVAEAVAAYLRPLTRNRSNFHGDYQKMLGLAKIRVLQQIKLVIWDLDNTFWEGIFEEGPVRYSEYNHELVIALSKNGIVNSICSFNNEVRVREYLDKMGISEYFIFPQIAYGSKGAMVEKIVQATGFRVENILFLDDDPRNRDEVEFYNDGLYSRKPDFLDAIDLDRIPVGDATLKRLAHYRILEEKAEKRASSQASNEDFLRMSKIRLKFISEPEPYADRIKELIERTNQLNFTKVRSQSIEQLTASPGVECKCIHVVDKFGDYGISGFYALDTKAHRLIQFVFSCRILGMGIEQYVYQLLGCPSIQVKGEVASRLDDNMQPDWIQITGEVEKLEKKPAYSSPLKTAPIKIVMRGGCDLKPMADYLYSIAQDRIAVTTEFHYITENRTRVYWSEHSEVVKLAISNLDGQSEMLGKIPWFDAQVWDTEFEKSRHDIYILSLLQDYSCALYEHTESGVCIPGEYFGINLCDPESDQILFGVGKYRAADFGINSEFLRWFRANFTYRGPISEARLKANLEKIRAALPASATLILINGADVHLDKHEYPFDEQQTSRHIALNEVIPSIVEALPNTTLLDVRSVVQSKDDVVGRLFHYRRQHYAVLASSLWKQILASRK